MREAREVGVMDVVLVLACVFLIFIFFWQAGGLQAQSQRLKAVGIVAPNGSGTNGVGTSLTIIPGRATGSAAGGDLILQTSDAGGSGSTLQTATTKVTLTTAGKLGVGTAAPTAVLDVLSDIIRLRTAKTPATSGAAGNAGDVCWDASYIYICTATNNWERAAIATW